MASMIKHAHDLQQAVAAELRAERAARQLTLDELAEASGVPKGTLFRYLKGSRDIPLTALDSIAQSLGVAAHEIVERAEGRMETTE